MSASHGYSTMGGIEYDDGGKYREDKKVRKSHINAANQRAMRFPSIDINAGVGIAMQRMHLEL